MYIVECRFANPASLNNATSWVFLNSPDNIQHVCASNVRNYGMRYLPVSSPKCMLTCTAADYEVVYIRII